MSGTGGFQTQVYDQPSAAVAGDRASQNPIFSYNAGPGALVAGSSLIIGTFAWVTPPDDPNGSPSIANSFGAGAPAGFVMRNQQGLQPTYLANAGMQIQPGFETALQISGDFWVVNNGTTEATYGMKAYANFLTGLVSFAATGAPTTGASATGSVIAAETFSVTASVANDIMTVTAVGSGSVYPGATVSATGIPSGTTVLSQLSGTAQGIGTYRLSVPELTIASGTITGTYGQLTVGTLTTTPVFAVGDTLNATGSVVAGTQITYSVSGGGGSGAVMIVNNNTGVSSQTISAVSNVETKFYCRGSALVGEVVKISSTPNAGGSN
jgi:hypothetical protein